MTCWHCVFTSRNRVCLWAAVFLSWLHLLLIPHAQRYHGCLDSGDSSLTFSAATLSQLYYRLFPQHKETATCPWKSVSEVLITAATSSNIQYPSCLCSSQTHVVQKWFVSIDDVIIFFFLPEINSVIFSLAGISSVSLAMTPAVYYSSIK